MRKTFVWLGTIMLSLLLAECSYAETQSANPMITVSLDIIECSPEKLTQYALCKKSEKENDNWMFDLEFAEENVRDKLAILKKDKDVKIIFSTKIATGAGNTAIVDNVQPIECFAYFVGNDGTPERPEWVLKKEASYWYEGNFAEITPTITEKKKIDCEINCWKGELIDKVKFQSVKKILKWKKEYKNIKGEGWPKEDIYLPVINKLMITHQCLLEDGETVISGVNLSETAETDKKGNFKGKTGKKARLIFIGADINKIPLCPG